MNAEPTYDLSHIDAATLWDAVRAWARSDGRSLDTWLGVDEDSDTLEVCAQVSGGGRVICGRGANAADAVHALAPKLDGFAEQARLAEPDAWRVQMTGLHVPYVRVQAASADQARQAAELAFGGAARRAERWPIPL